MNPQVPDYPVGGPSPWAANGPAGSTIVAQPMPTAAAPAPVPYPTTPPTPRRRPGWYAVWSMVGLALILAITAVALSVATLKTRAPMSATVTATPPTATFAPGDVAASKRSVCAASINADKAIVAAQRHFFDVQHDRQSPDYRPALGNWQLVASLETTFLERQLTPAVPQDVKDATNGYIAATMALVDANTRQLTDQDAQPFVLATRDAGDKLDKVCD